MKIDQNKIINQLYRSIGSGKKHAMENLNWLLKTMNPYFFITFAPEKDALLNLCFNLHTLGENRQLVLKDTDEKFIVATLNRPGTLFNTLDGLKDKFIIYEEMIHSNQPLPGREHELEILKFHFLTDEAKKREAAPFRGKGLIYKTLKESYPAFNFKEFDKIFQYFMKKSRDYVLLSPALRVARAMWMYQSAIREGGIFLDIEPTVDEKGRKESRLVFSVINPLFRGYLAKVIEIFYRLDIATHRNYVVEIEGEDGQNVTVLTAYITTRDGRPIEKDMAIFKSLEAELYNTKVINIWDRVYKELVTGNILTGPEGSLLSAIHTFTHTNLAHAFPYRYDWNETEEAFFSHLQLTKDLLSVFMKKFEPDPQKRLAPDALEDEFKRIEESIEEYNTGHAFLDETRKTVYKTALLMIRFTLKTNFFVKYKKSLSFRLDPLYMEYLPSDVKKDLPDDLPFRITFFYHRYGSGYHFGFSDIARGGFRTIIARTKDDFETAMETIFKEAMVLAHTQQLKNKDIYQGGSKLAVVMRAFDVRDRERETNRLYNLQRGIINAFLDIFVTKEGRPVDPNVVDYYGDDEPIEVGPDENMHDSMIEYFANRAKERGYILGSGVISSKKIGINHKEYGVTSLGVLKFVQRTLKELRIDCEKNPFTVKITGGTNGDVAGNEMNLLIKRCPRVKILSITAGSGAIYDPQGIDKEELSRLLLKENIDKFSPEYLHEGGFILYSREKKQEGFIIKNKKVIKTGDGVEEHWVTSDDFHSEFENLIFSHTTDIFIPAGGRPETIHDGNWEKLFDEDGKPTTRAIVEGANSFISPSAREKIQRRGIIIMKDASANKCGVICSSYEIIGGLLMSDREFLENKPVYVPDVLEILEKRAVDEANLIFERYHQYEGRKLYTEISNKISYEINDLTNKIYKYLIKHPDMASNPPYSKILLLHFPKLIQKRKKFRDRVKYLPLKYRIAMISTEIATRIVYHGGFEVPFEEKLREFAKNLGKQQIQ